MSVIEYQNIVDKTKDLLENNTKWASRYQGYARNIEKRESFIFGKRQGFRVKMPLYVYSTISKINKSTQNNVVFDLRYEGQSVASIQILNNDRFITSKDNIEEYFGCNIKLNKEPWGSKKARLFRKYFYSNPLRQETAKKRNNEHRMESLLLTDFSKKMSNNKSLLNIQPIHIFGSRFQMPTPLKACEAKNDFVDYKEEKGGGIDILARVKHGNKSNLAVLELKDENNTNEPPELAIKQAIAYSVFIRSLIRSKDSNNEFWWKFFKFGGAIPDSLIIYAIVVMPTGTNKTDFQGLRLTIGERDAIELHYIYTDKEANNVIETSLKNRLGRVNEN